ncbi:MAG: hypothetical protein C4K58_00020 [Flavobacteriaceae bacterium]|nr:MAG: hypothetical protein C4K58_00020 [Flavobacteriaceae bacterium]
MNLDIKNIVSTYYSNNLDLFMEQGVLKAIELMDIWDCLSDIEKNNKRKAEIDYSKKHSLRSEKQQQYEELVIKIAGFIIDFIEN